MVAFNRNLEACFKTYAIHASGTIVFQERGPRLEALIQTFKTTARGLTSDADQKFMEEVWLEKLIRAAVQQGAKIPSK